MTTLLLLAALCQAPATVTVNVNVNVAVVTPAPPVRMGWNDEMGHWYPTWAEADAWNEYYYQVRVATWLSRGHRVPIR